LKTYLVFEPEGAGLREAAERTEFVREKFSWPAFFFTPLWLLYKRLWLAFVIYCAAETLIGVSVRLVALDPVASVAAMLLPSLIVAFEAAQLQRFRLQRKGYREADVMIAEGLEIAERRYFERRKNRASRSDASSSPSAIMPISRPANSVIGLFPERGR
jgi:uncharacterized protein DUF2628